LERVPGVGLRADCPDRSKLPLVAAWLHDEVTSPPTFEAWRDGLVGLSDPPTGRDAWQDLLDAVKAIAAGNEDQIAAANEGNVKSFAAATQRLNDLHPASPKAADAAGASACADVHARRPRRSVDTRARSVSSRARHSGARSRTSARYRPRSRSSAGQLAACAAPYRRRRPPRGRTYITTIRATMITAAMATIETVEAATITSFSLP
jgi:hypothetical protein